MVRAVFRSTHAGFAAELLEDCRTELLRVTSTLDGYIDLARHLNSSTSAAIVSCAPGNRDALVAAAGYAQWISDHIRQQGAQWQRADSAAAAGYMANDRDQRLLQGMRDREEFCGDTIAPSPTPPPGPGVLENIESLSDRRRLLHARELCAEALWAAGKSDTEGMRTVCGHIETLLSWLQREVPDERGSIEVCSYTQASTLAMHMLNAKPVGSDEDWAATLLAGSALGALLFAASGCGNSQGMTWVRSVAATLCDPQYNVPQAIRRVVDGE